MAEDPDAIEDDENPEWAEADFARARPFKEVFPEHYKAWKRIGRPSIVMRKAHIPCR